MFRHHSKEAIGFRFGGVVTLVTSFTYALLGFLERFTNDEFRDNSGQGRDSNDASKGFNVLIDEHNSTKNSSSSGKSSGFNILEDARSLRIT